MTSECWGFFGFVLLCFRVCVFFFLRVCFVVLVVVVFQKKENEF